MSNSTSDLAIVLRHLDFSETSQVLAMLTREHGQERVIAKGVKRSTKTRPAVGIDLLELGRIVYSRRPGNFEGLATLIEWKQEDGFIHLQRDLLKLYAAQYAADVTSQLTELHDPHPALFDSLQTLLSDLATGEPTVLIVSFLWRLLGEIGLLPDLARCMNCHRELDGGEVRYFSSRQGGAICRDCEPAMVEKRRMPAGLAEIFTGTVAATSTQWHDAFELLDYHFRETIGRPPKLSKLLSEAMERQLRR